MHILGRLQQLRSEHIDQTISALVALVVETCIFYPCFLLMRKTWVANAKVYIQIYTYLCGSCAPVAQIIGGPV